MTDRTGILSYLDLPYGIKSAMGSYTAGILNDWLVAHPQELVDAMVEAGVLEPQPNFRGNNAMYRVVQPHTHDWRVDRGYVSREMSTLFLMCLNCTETREVPNRLPIEVPT